MKVDTILMCLTACQHNLYIQAYPNQKLFVAPSADLTIFKTANRILKVCFIDIQHIISRRTMQIQI